MPPLPAVPGVIKVELLYDCAGYGAANILHWSYTGGPPAPADCAALATQIRTAFAATLPAAMSNQVTLVAVVVTDLSSAMGANGQDLTAVPGVILSQIPAIQVAIVTKWPVSVRYRGGHPKTFWPPLGLTSTNGVSNWSNVAASNWASLVNDFVGLVNVAFSGSTAISEHVAVSYYHAHAVRPVPVVLSLGDAVADPRFGSQRRRRDEPVSI